MPQLQSEEQRVGAWAGDDLSVVAAANVGLGADADLPDHVRFISGMIKLIARRRAHPTHAGDPNALAIFLLSSEGPKGLTSAKRVPMLNNALTPLAGRLWAVSAAVVAGHFIDLPTATDDEIFALVAGKEETKNARAIVYDPRTTPASIRYYPNGLEDVEVVSSLELTANVTLDAVFSAIDLIYETALVTPDAQQKAGKLWSDSDKWWVSKNAEDTVQLYLSVGLTMAFPHCTVRHEQPDVTGRLDLEIEERDPSDGTTITRHAVLELKVLRSFGSTGITRSDNDTAEWIKTGVEQAASYRDQRGVRAAALCCFDMRKTLSAECFQHVAQMASSLKVELRRWYLFASAKEYRSYEAAQAALGAS